jgi:Fur family peroxide stress response transcriptional regulator
VYNKFRTILKNRSSASKGCEGVTKQRQLVFEVVHNSCEHLTAEQVFNLAKEQMPTIVMATVYNNLNALTDCGLLRRVSIHGEPDR